MKPAILLHKIYTTDCPNKLKFSYTSISTIFLGWKDETKKVEWSMYLDCLKTLTYSYIYVNEVFQNQEFHLSEAQLINKLEKKQIGRPSTYTNILESIEKNYVCLGKITGKEFSLKHYKLKNNLLKDTIEETTVSKTIDEVHKLSLTTTGKEVDLFCYKHFEPIFNYEYTKNMELSLDRIEHGEIEWKTILREYIENVNQLLNIEDIPKVYTSLHAGYYEKSPVVIKDGIHGFYLEYKEKSMSLSNYKEKDQIYSWILEQKVPDESFKTLIHYLLTDKVIINITDSWSVRNGPHGKYLYFKAKNMKQPKFYKYPDHISSESREEMETYIRNKYKTI